MLIINDNFIILLILALCGIQIKSGAFLYISLITLPLLIVIQIIAYGRFIEVIKGEQISSNILILKENWLNYLVVNIILFIPLLVFSLLPLRGWTSYIAQRIFGALINILTIYVLPLVYIKKENIVAIVGGILFMLRSLQYSLPLAAIVFFMFLIEVLFKITFYKFIHGIILFAVIAFPLNIIFYYLSFTVFNMASMVLIYETDIKPATSP